MLRIESELSGNTASMRDAFIIVFIILLGVVMYGLTLRGAPGNPTFNNITTAPANPFESTHERGPYAHVVSLADSGHYNIPKEWANIVTPDVGVSSDGKYYTFFAPGVPYLTLPFYLFGAQFGFGQVAAFAAESLASIITLVFIYLIGVRIFTLPRWAAFFAVLTYGFASTSWGYAITLYQNAFTACFIVTAFYAAWRFSRSDGAYSWLYAAYVWLAYALAIFVDYPNAVLMLPVMIYLAVSTFSFKNIGESIAVSIRWSAIATFSVFAFVTGLQFWHNAAYYGGWSHLAGELKNYKVVTATSTPALMLATKSTSTTTPTGATFTSTSTPLLEDKTAVGFFHEKLMPNGLQVLLIGDERGLFFFSPIFLFSLLGIMYALRKKREGAMYIVPIALIAVNIFLYSSWGDPWGGWAYGPRYLIACMPWLALFVGIALSTGRFLMLKKILAFILFLFSSAIALLGAITTNMVPTKGDSILLPSHQYNFLYNLSYLKGSKTGSFIYNDYFTDHMSLIGYSLVIFFIVSIIAIVTLLSSYRRHE